MKNNVLLSLFILLLSCSNIKKSLNNSQSISFVATQKSYKSLKSFNGDTLAYVKENFINNKENYIGKEINSILDKLELPIVKYYLGIHPTIEKYYYITLQFYNDIEEAKRIKNKVSPITLNIEIESPVETLYPVSFYRKDKQQWTQEAINFWGKQKIKNIGIVDYGF